MGRAHNVWPPNGSIKKKLFVFGGEFRHRVQLFMESPMNFLQLTPDRLDVGSISDLVTDETCGAISLFVGTTRDYFEDKKVLTLDYVAYEPMAIKMMTNICNAIRCKWDDVRKIAIYHRLGVVPVKEASVVIAISSPHRQASLEAVQFAIEELKKSVPIWKKEQYTTDDSEWKENKECSGKNAKRCKLDLNDCPIEPQAVSQSLVQIGADETEILRRIHCFVEKKREEIDLNNIRDFTATKSVKDNIQDEKPDEGSCARTNSTVIKQADSKGHLRVRRVKNRIGPQIKPDYLQTLDKLMKTDSATEIQIKEERAEEDEDVAPPDLPLSVKERLQNVESHLNVKVIDPKHVYERIKAVENKILYLESISPEYKHFLTEKPIYMQEPPRSFKKITYSVEEIDVLIEDMKADIEREEQKE